VLRAKSFPRVKVAGPVANLAQRRKQMGSGDKKTNEELENLFNHENIVRHIKSKRLSWVGHVE